jgi:hypothetical protein
MDGNLSLGTRVPLGYGLPNTVQQGLTQGTLRTCLHLSTSLSKQVQLTCFVCRAHVGTACELCCLCATLPCCGESFACRVYDGASTVSLSPSLPCPPPYQWTLALQVVQCRRVCVIQVVT